MTGIPSGKGCGRKRTKADRPTRDVVSCRDRQANPAGDAPLHTEAAGRLALSGISDFRARRSPRCPLAEPPVAHLPYVIIFNLPRLICTSPPKHAFVFHRLAYGLALSCRSSQSHQLD